MKIAGPSLILLVNDRVVDQLQTHSNLFIFLAHMSVKVALRCELGEKLGYLGQLGNHYSLFVLFTLVAIENLFKLISTFMVLAGFNRVGIRVTFTLQGSIDRMSQALLKQVSIIEA